MAVHYKANGQAIGVSPANGKDFSGAELKEFIGGGYLEIVRLRDGKLLVCDEDGQSKKLPVNMAATDLYNAGSLVTSPMAAPKDPEHNEMWAESLADNGIHPVRGDVLVCRPEDVT